MIASLIYDGRKVRNLDFLLLTPLNESDHDCREGPCVDASQYVTILKALIAELDTGTTRRSSCRAGYCGHQRRQGIYLPDDG